jgi:hypothetical protein
MPKNMRNIGKYADNVMNVMREIAHMINIYTLDEIFLKFYSKASQSFETIRENPRFKLIHQSTSPHYIPEINKIHFNI